MVEVTRVFIHSYDREDVEKTISMIKKKFNVLKVYESSVVPNYVFVEVEGLLKNDVEEVLRELGLEDFKVFEVNA